MIHPKYIEELKSAPIDKVDFVATFQEVRLRGHDCVEATGPNTNPTDVRRQVHNYGQPLHATSPCRQSTSQSASGWVVSKPTLSHRLTGFAGDLMPAIEEEILDSFDDVWPQCDGKVLREVCWDPSAKNTRLDRGYGRRQIRPIGWPCVKPYVWRYGTQSAQGMG